MVIGNDPLSRIKAGDDLARAAGKIIRPSEPPRHDRDQPFCQRMLKYAKTWLMASQKLKKRLFAGRVKF
jgi:hypothetical protein